MFWIRRLGISHPVRARPRSLPITSSSGWVRGKWLVLSISQLSLPGLWLGWATEFNVEKGPSGAWPELGLPHHFHLTLSS